MKLGILLAAFASIVAFAGCATFNTSNNAEVTTVPPWLCIDIRSDSKRPYRILVTGRDYTRREMLSYLHTVASRQHPSRAIVIRPGDKTVDLDRRYSTPLITYARRNEIPVTYLDPAANAIDTLLISSTPYGVPSTAPH